MKTVFRVDASKSIGAGHLMRCLALAEALRARGVKSVFLCRRQPGNLVELIRQRGITAVELQFIAIDATSTDPDSAEDAALSIDALCESGTDWIVVDHYGIGAAWERLMRPYTRRIMVIDDLASRAHDCDVLLNQSVSGPADIDYTGLLPDSCERMLGPEYALLRPEFAALRASLTQRDGALRNILVFFTTGNDQGETLKALEAMRRLEVSASVNVVIGSSNLDREEIEAACMDQGWNCHCQTDDMARLIAGSDFVIGSGGSNSLERCALGVPASVTLLADNQELLTKWLTRQEAVINLGRSWATTPQDYLTLLESLTPDRLRLMSCKAHAIVDARGAERVADYMLAESTISSAELKASQ